jgi:hypothetical protein
MSSKKIAASYGISVRPRTAAQRTTTPVIEMGAAVAVPSGSSRLICIWLMTGSAAGVRKRMPEFDRSTIRVSTVFPAKVNRRGCCTATRGSLRRSMEGMRSR